ncbi:hypothetical protein CYL18_02600 [Pradoshia eiseniae]|uniref:Uncharacterized protein n=1 Tax=Pradoshia eiseniae TaxID=2064768 RepID=A0A2S7N446_9BACI|nr:hypothetical protein CYL18_02600 [Pradoshia eiseniae]
MMIVCRVLLFDCSGKKGSIRTVKQAAEATEEKAETGSRFQMCQRKRKQRIIRRLPQEKWGINAEARLAPLTLLFIFPELKDFG